MNGTDQSLAGSLAPFPFFRCEIAIRNGIITGNTDKVINPYDIIHLCRKSHTVFPPCKSVIFHLIPVIKRVAPQLTCRAEIIRRHTGNRDGTAIFIELEQIRMPPDVCTVQRHVNRNITNDLNPVIICIRFQLTPLPVKLKLAELPEIDIVLQDVPVVIHRH